MYTALPGMSHMLYLLLISTPTPVDFQSLVYVALQNKSLPNSYQTKIQEESDNPEYLPVDIPEVKSNIPSILFLTKFSYFPESDCHIHEKTLYW